ncbi:Patatin-like phospholipase domain-containing protein 7 [Holothuria leucospilota]|uniref:Patatin-like phospholipase domain-containing protein 7 n=1 Tax=Holothuria leucospilota TaxID=206669 RepID=A0A9Q1C5U1_HOLLE|nr:Patatin-like phospholipase domain-containing protein 7 [Holothuria leucospilota]
MKYLTMDAGENENGVNLEDAKKRMLGLLKSGFFGHLEDKVCERLANDVKVIQLQKGEHIHTGNQIHNNVHIVQHGTLKLCFREGEVTRKGKEKKQDEHVTIVRNVQEGESLYSLFNIAAEMTGYQHDPIVYAEATEDSTIIRLPIDSIINLARENAIFKIRLLQMMLIRSSSIMRIIHSIPGIQAEVYSKLATEVVSSSNSESDKARCIEVAHDAKLWGEYHDFQYQEFLWGKNVKPYAENETDDLQKYISVFEVEPDVEIAQRHCKVMDLVYVVSGTVVLVDNKSEDNESETQMTKHTLLGTVSVLTGESQQYDIKAGENGCTVALISRKSVFDLIRNDVKVILRLCYYKIREMSDFLRLLDIALGWDFLNAGKKPVRILSTGVLFVLTGRLRLHEREKDRDSQVARIPTDLCKYFMKKYPEAFFTKISDLINRITPKNFEIEQVFARRKFSTVVCIPTSDNVPLKVFQTNLKHAVERYGTTLEIDEDILKHVPGDSTDGSDAKNSVSELQIRSYLGSLERDNTIICYSTKWNLSNEWDKLFLQQADMVFVIGDFDNKPSNLDTIKEALKNSETEKALILLHKPTNGTYKNPFGTTEWIELLGVRRSRHFQHFHIRCPEEMFSDGAVPFDPSMGRANEALAVDSTDGTIHDDFGRLGRYLLGKSIGLVLGGGGARGFAHVGIIKAMEEYDIPFDAVGGTSMGAFVGASYCSSLELNEINRQMEDFCRGMNSCRLYLDLTLPILSVSTADVMRKKHKECETIFAVDVGGKDNLDFFNYGDHISGWWILWNRFLPRRYRQNIPNFMQVVTNLSCILGNEDLKKVMQNPAFNYIRPDGINKFGLLDFKKYNEIKDCGYEEGKKYFKKWKNHET